MNTDATELLVDALNTVDGVAADIHDSGKRIDVEEPIGDDTPPFSAQTFTVRIQFEEERTERREDLIESIIEKHEVVLRNQGDEDPRRDFGDEIHIVTKEIHEH